MQVTSPVSVEREIAQVPFWWHSINIHGHVTHGLVPLSRLEQVWRDAQIPSLTGKSVLDIGAWDGGFSFMAERAGAQRIVALDSYAWERKTGAAYKLYQELTAAGVSATEERLNLTVDRVSLPGKQGFDTARRLLGSRVESIYADFMTADIDSLGGFDVVLYLGILYHQIHPMLALQRLAQVTKELAVIETEAIRISGYENRSLCEFFETTELNNDYTSWWAPNRRALEGMCRAAGFSRVEVSSFLSLTGIARPLPVQRVRSLAGQTLRALKLKRPLPAERYRLIAKAWK